MDVSEEGGVTLLRYAPCHTNKPAQPSQAQSAVSRGKEKLLTRLRRRSRSAPRTRNKSERDSKEDPNRGNNTAPNNRDSIIYEANGERVKNSEGGSRRRARPESVELVGFSSTSALSIPSLQHSNNNNNQYSQNRRAGNVPTTNKTSAELKEERKQRHFEMNNGGNSNGGSRRPSQNSDKFNMNNNHNNNNMNGVYPARHFADFSNPADSLLSSLKLSASSDLLAAERERMVAQRQLFQQAVGFGRSSDIVNQFWKEREDRFRRLTSGGGGVGTGIPPPGGTSYMGAGGGGTLLPPPPGYSSGGIYPPPPGYGGMGEGAGAFLRGSESKLSVVYPEYNNTTTSSSNTSSRSGSEWGPSFPLNSDNRLAAASSDSRLEASTSLPGETGAQSSFPGASQAPNSFPGEKKNICLPGEQVNNSNPTPSNQTFATYSSKQYDIGGSDQGEGNNNVTPNNSVDQVKSEATAKPRERIIPIQVLDSPMLPPRRTIPEAEQQLGQSQPGQHNHQQGSQQQQQLQQGSHQQQLQQGSQQQQQLQQGSQQHLLSEDSSTQQQPPFDLTTGFPSIFNDLKLSDRHPLFEHGRITSNIPAAFGRISSNLGDDISALRSGIRDSFFGMQSNFGKFPTFGPILPEDSLNLSPHTRRNGPTAHKKRLQKRHASGQKAPYRFAGSDCDGDENHLAVNSETESDEEDDLDSVSVVARTRDRLSGTGSTQSEDSHHSGGESSVASGGSNSSTLSNDSGIAEEYHHAVINGTGAAAAGGGTGGVVATRRQNGTKAARPISAVPSELSDVSNLSNLSIASRTSDDSAKYDSDNFSSADQLPPADSLQQTGPPATTIPEKAGVGSDSPAGQTSTSPATNINTSEESDNSKSLNKSYLIAKELLSTEIHYVSKLHLIDQVFHFRLDCENRNLNIVPQDTIQTIFSNIKSIYKFHAEFLLPQLQERMDLWSASLEQSPDNTQPNPQVESSKPVKSAAGNNKTGQPEKTADPRRIGDIMLRYSPFLIMYTEYVKNFDTAMRTINNLYNKNSKFAAIMDSIHGMEESENLSLQHHMLCPVQRIPRYEMLLRDYLNNLPKDSPDRLDSGNALKQVSQAAAHANDSMKRIEQFKKLLETQESIYGNLDLVSPTRELIKEGKIVKISARTGDHQDRYMFLLTDLLLLCSPRKSMISGAQYGLRAKFHVENLQVSEGDNLVTANTFYLRDDTKSVELYTNTQEEKEEWIQALFYAINTLYTRKSSLRVGRDILRPLECEIGKKKPHLQKLETAVKCAECAAQFSLLKPKHNCRTCGAVFCGKCCDLKHPLSWEDGRKGRVCKSCHVLLTNQTDPKPNQALIQRPRGLLEVPAFTASPIRSGWLTLRTPHHKPYKRFFLLLSDFVLYSFKSETDTVALTATPLPGYQVATGGQLRGDGQPVEKECERTIRLQHPSREHPSRVSKKRINYFVSESVHDAQRWAELMRLAAKAELPNSYKDDLHSGAYKDDFHSDDRKSTSSTEYENS